MPFLNYSGWSVHAHAHCTSIKTARTLGRKGSQLRYRQRRVFCLAERGLYLWGKSCPQIMLFARVIDYALLTGVRVRAVSGSTPDYPDDEHETLCGCCVWPSQKGSANELLNFI